MGYKLWQLLLDPVNSPLDHSYLLLEALLELPSCPSRWAEPFADSIDSSFALVVRLRLF